MSEPQAPPSSGAARRGTGRDPGRQVRHPALLDADTGLPNRLHFDTVFEVVFEMGDRGVPVSLVLFRIPELEAYEADRGAESRAAAVREFGRTLGSVTRRTDVFARLGDDLFASLLMDCNLHGARIAADRLGDMVAEWSERTGLQHATGLATWQPGMRQPAELRGAARRDLEEAVARAR